MSSSSSQLEAFYEGRHIGSFTREGRRISFEYADSAAPDSFVLSLSLPRDGKHAASAAENYLSGLLPDNPRVRQDWARHFGVPDTAFDLASAMGEDVAGAVVLLPHGKDPATADPAVVATSDDIAARIASLTRNPDAWVDPELIGKVRMSLAGAQGKFTLARVGGKWFFPAAGTPSTHILKPPAQTYGGAAELEAGSLALARQLGIDAPSARAISVRGQRSYLVERFDREVLPSGQTRRLHAEDFLQALGRDPGQKYRVTALDVIGVLKAHAPEEDMYAFVGMLAFNTAIGNADAHGKNYSIMLDEGRARLAPLYDALPTRVWPGLSGTLAMGVSGEALPQAVTPGHWAKLARRAGLYPDRVVGIAAEIAHGVAERAHDAYRDAGASAETLSRVDEVIAEATRGVLRPAPQKPAPAMLRPVDKYPELRDDEDTQRGPESGFSL